MYWTIPVLLFPLLGFVLNLGLARFEKNRLISAIGVLAVLLPFIFLLYSLATTPILLNHYESWYNWLSLGKFSIPILFYWDRLSIIMSLIILGVGSVIHLFSVGYMQGEGNLGRYFSYMNLFVFFMLVLVLSSNMLGTFIGWEGVGLCSYLLIGYYYERGDAIQAAPKAFIVNRIGDWGFLLAIFMFFGLVGTLEYLPINIRVQEMVTAGTLNLNYLTLVCLLLFWACIGKSAQFPLYTWLPDAMSGPTPVSALIHAATMVTAGVYIVLRLFPVFDLAPNVSDVILAVGLISALFAAIIACQQTDIKKVLAYSTISQLGFMFMALGASDFQAALFHLTTHAFFKALLFLSAGAVIYQLHHKQEFSKMGGLRKKLRTAFLATAVGAWCLAGLPFGAGFFSKDEILASLYNRSQIAWALALLASLLTAFYIYRLVYLTFIAPSKKEQAVEKLPASMNYTLLFLSLCSILIGFTGLPAVLDFFGTGHIFGQFLSSNATLFHEAEHSVGLEWGLILVSVAIAVLGWFYARLRYKNGSGRKVTEIIKNGFYIDEIYNDLVVNPLKVVASSLNNFFEPLWYYLPIYLAKGFFNSGRNFGEVVRSSELNNYFIPVALFLLILGMALSILL